MTHNINKKGDAATDTKELGSIHAGSIQGIDTNLTSVIYKWQPFVFLSTYESARRNYRQKQ